ncbi:MAG: beta-galactosidase trimerization domain-containing protein [Lentisphaeria bacterium]|nr:beta-galactosidase trimerization domain-containing protein [Lentisphaeria bacterium]
MMVRIFAFAGLLLSFSLSLTAAVKVTVNNGTAVLDNGIIRTQFSANGGKMTHFTAFKNGKNMVYTGKGKDTGALKDQFAPKDVTLRTADYTIKGETLPDGTGELTLTSPSLTGDWNFVSVIKKISLAPGNSRLDVRITIKNKLERMSPYTFIYWSHSYLGIPGEDNYLTYAGKTGIVAAVPTVKKNTYRSKPVTDFTRNFIAFMAPASKLGVVVLPEYSELDSFYSWYCKSGAPQDTLEFKLIQDQVKNGSSITKQFSIAAVSRLEQLSGAGKTGAGYLKSTPDGVTLHLTGFANKKETFQLFINGKKQQDITVSLAPGKLVTKKLGVNGKHYRLVSKNFDMESKTDKTGKLLPLNLAPMGKKRPAVITDTERYWQYDPKADYVTPHNIWQTGGKENNILFLLPANGSRDVIELQQRLKIKPTVPTVFPHTLSWQTVAELIQRHENGLDHLPQFLKKKYDMLVVGGNAGAAKIRHGKGTWSSYPAHIRKKLLQMCHSGSGLLIINAGTKDPQLNKIAKTLQPLSAEMTKTMSFSAAPFLPETKIRMGNYGKGRLVLVEYPTDSFLVPQPGYRTWIWRQPRPDHRYQEYQFAILGKLIQWTGRQEPFFHTISGKDNTSLLIKTAKSGEGSIEILDQYSQSYHKEKFRFKQGDNLYKLPSLRYGKNYLHVTASNGDYGFFCMENKKGNFIKEIKLVNTGKAVKGNIIPASKLQKNDKLRISVVDNMDRLLYTTTSADGTFHFAPQMILTNRHELRAELLRNGKTAAEKRQDFYLPALRNTVENYTNMLWVCGDQYPVYSYPYRYKQYSEFGFNFHYSGSGNNGMLPMVRYSDAECGSNGHGCTGLFYDRNVLTDLKRYNQTNDKTYLVRTKCPNDPKFKDYLASDALSRRMDEYGTRKVFQLGDEMSMTYHTASADICMCQYCMKEFRLLMQKKYGSIEKLNAAWDCKFKSWNDVLPLTLNEVILKDNRAPYLEHRLYMDEVFRRTLDGYRQRLKQKYPGAIVGPTGVPGYPSPYNGNSNFYSMKEFDCGSFYQDTRIPVSFNREKRLVMRYRGYSNTQAETVYCFWEGLAIGERGNNNWFGAIFLNPDLRLPAIRQYYSDLLWELRSGMGDLLYHNKKVTNTAAILHSQQSLIVNYTKIHKTDFYSKEKDFARILEDLAIPYRFIAPEELDQLDQFKILLLPESSALSDNDVKKITAFVKRGGILIADVEPATFDESGRKRNIAALDSLFGIESKNTSQRKIRSTTFKDLKITHACRGIKTKSAKAQASAKIRFNTVPLWIENKAGKGKTLLLNFVTDYAATRSNGKNTAFLQKFRNFLSVDTPGHADSKRPIMHGTFANGDQQYFVLLPEVLSGEKPAAFRTPFVLNKKCHLYDVRKGKYLGYGTRFNITLIPGDGSMLAALPWKVEKVTLKRTGTDKLSVSVRTSNGAKTDGILVLKCFAPDGKERKAYHQVMKYSNGNGQFHLPFALNETPGKWRITVTDAASKIRGEITVDLH